MQRHRTTIPAPTADAPSDLELLGRIRTPADAAPLYDRYVEAVYRYCYRRVSDSDLAADLTSTIFTRAIEALPRFKPRTSGTFRAWLFTIAHNVVIDSYRSQRPTGVMPPDPPDHALGPEERAVHNDEFARLLAVLHHLPEQHRQIIELRLAGLTAAEIATTLNLSRAAVKSAQTRAYARLRDLLAAPSPSRDGVAS